MSDWIYARIDCTWTVVQFFLYVIKSMSYKENNPTFSSFISIYHEQKLNILKDSGLKQLEDVFSPKFSLGNISNSKTEKQSGICFFQPWHLNCKIKYRAGGLLFPAAEIQYWEEKPATATSKF